MCNRKADKLPLEVQTACSSLAKGEPWKLWLEKKFGGPFYIGDHLPAFARDRGDKLILPSDLHDLSIEFGRTRLFDIAEKYGLRE